MIGLEYANARTAARRARLLGPRGLRELLARPTTPERLAMLADGCWRGALPATAAAGPVPLRTVAHGLVADGAGEAREVLSFLEGRPRQRVAALLRLQDAPVLEGVLRGLMRRDPALRIVAGTWPSPGLGPELVAELAALPTPARVPELLTRRGSPLGSAAASALEAAREEPRLVRLGVALQRAIVAGVRDALSGWDGDARLGRELVAQHVDHVNATTLLAVEVLVHPADLFVAGGRLDADGFARLAGLPMPERRVRLAAWIGPARGPRALDPALLANPTLTAQHLLQVRERELQRRARTAPLSIAVPLAFLAARTGEARRLRLLLLGAEHGLPVDDLLDLVEA